MPGGATTLTVSEPSLNGGRKLRPKNGIQAAAAIKATTPAVTTVRR